jgi:hypothetical protein
MSDAWVTCDRPGCFNEPMVPVLEDLAECPRCGAMADIPSHPEEETS